MKEEARVQYLFLDMNSYFASVEQQENPSLLGRPVAVVPILTEKTCAIAASYEAKAFGIKTGTMIYEAKKLCPDLVIIPARHDVYVEYHHAIMEELERHLPIETIHSVDEAVCRLIGDECRPEPRHPPGTRNQGRDIQKYRARDQMFHRSFGQYLSGEAGNRTGKTGRPFGVASEPVAGAYPAHEVVGPSLDRAAD